MSLPGEVARLFLATRFLSLATCVLLVVFGVATLRSTCFGYAG